MSEFTVTEIIDRIYGGTGKAAEAFGLGMSSISNWKADDRIPPNWHRRVDIDARAAGLTIPDEVFERWSQQTKQTAGGPRGREDSPPEGAAA